ncbi:MAG: serine/threonine-protein kinase, partial [Myxococcota bacterium]
TQLSTQRHVAIKVLRPQLLSDPTALKRFRQEARYACRLSHPNLVTYYEFGQDPELGLMYVVMELLVGESIEAHIRKQGPIALSRVATIIDQVCGALSQAHSIGLVHRDIKPDNVMLTHRMGHDDFVKVIDFGLAKAIAPILDDTGSLTADGVILGSPHYISPEQLRAAGNIDARTDIYALACTAYKMLTGLTPFRGRSPVDVATQHLFKTPEPLSAMLAHETFPRPLELLIAQALSKDPNERPATALEFARRFREAATQDASPRVGRGHATLLDEKAPDLTAEPPRSPSSRPNHARRSASKGSTARRPSSDNTHPSRTSGQRSAAQDTPTLITPKPINIPKLDAPSEPTTTPTQTRILTGVVVLLTLIVLAGMVLLGLKTMGLG